ncbi:MAG TPA: PIN domain-containing protein [Dissulfurispiraceae bacterium]
MKVFVDTGAFIALADSDDLNHKAGRLFYEAQKEQGARFLTTNFVICETLNYLRSRVSHNAAVAFWEGLRKSGLFEIVAVTMPVEDTAFHIFKKYEDKDFSFTDCTSFAVMQSLKLRKVFAFDRHFEQFGSFKRFP